MLQLYVFDALYLFFVFNFQNELTAKCHEVIALKSEVRDLLQKLESKERSIHDLEGKRPARCVDGENDGNACDELTEDKLYSIVGRLNEQVYTVISIRLFMCIYTRTEVSVHQCLIIIFLLFSSGFFITHQKFSSQSPTHLTSSPVPALSLNHALSGPPDLFPQHQSTR